MQYKVPQNVDIEDRVIGPLTLRQFMILLIAVGVIIVLNFLMVGPLRLLFWLVAMIIMAIAVVFAFANYGEQKMEIFFMSALRTFMLPMKRVWKKEEATIQETHKATGKNPTQEKEVAQKKDIAEAKNDFQRLAEIVDSGGFSVINAKDRLAAPEPPRVQDEGVSDIIAPTEMTGQVDQLMNQATPPQNTEPKISQMASVSPNVHYDYEQIQKAPEVSPKA
jgi:hypothetical protein